jgi:hypothetical protein
MKESQAGEIAAEFSKTSKGFFVFFVFCCCCCCLMVRLIGTNGMDLKRGLGA